MSSAPRARFATRLLQLTAGIHVVLVVALCGLAEVLGAPWPLLWAVVGAAALFAPFPSRLRAMMWDRPRSAWTRHLVDEPYFVHWCAAFGAALPIAVLCMAAPAVDLAHGAPMHVPTRAALGVYAVWLLVAFHGVVIRRRRVVVRRLDVVVRGLPEAFDGYRIAQLSDLHIGGIVSRALSARWVLLANREAPDLTVVTGDVVTSGVLFHGAIAEVLGALEARDGVVFSPGNHDYFDIDDLVGKLEASGVQVLRNSSRRLERGTAAIRLAAVDDTWTGHADLRAALARDQDLPTVLLAHDPDLFEDAASLGAHLVLSGHTHGGQVAVPFLVRWANLSRLRHAYTYGRYTRGDATLYVHGGLGTTGPPFRLGVPPEIAILTLRRGLGGGV